MARFDENGDGKLDLEEFQRRFNTIDSHTWSSYFDFAGSWIQRKRVKGEEVRMEKGEGKVLSQMQVRDEAASPRSRLGEGRSSCPTNTLAPR